MSGLHTTSTAKSGSSTTALSGDDAPTLPEPGADPFAWLEEVESEQALDWVRERNRRTDEQLAASERFAGLEAEVREVLDNDERIPYVGLAGGYLFNFWRDAEHPRGIWRRTTETEYSRDVPEWEVLLDLDELNRTEGQDWVWHGAQVLRPGCDRALLRLSHGGSDTDVTREFDLTTKQFVSADDGGFIRPAAKGSLGWIDRDTVFVSTDFGPGTLTQAGYPRTVRRWRRGTALEEAELIYAGAEDDMYIGAEHDRTIGYERDFVFRSIAFYDAELFLLAPDNSLTLIEVPRSAEASVHREWLTVELREDWNVAGKTHVAGSLLVIDFEQFLAGNRDFVTVFTPTPSVSLASSVWTRHHLVLTVLDDVKNRVEVWTAPASADEQWRSSALAGAPSAGTTTVWPVDPHESDDVWVDTTDFLTPSALFRLPALGTRVDPEPLKSMPALFDATDLTTTQHFATSADGTRVPYFLVQRSDAQPHGQTPTILYGYGGFEISLTPSYSAAIGRAWLARGGAYAVANIRGGGEYGPQWHQSALKANRFRAYEDFAAVARDLAERGVTSPQHLAVKGGSNGGLLTGNMLVREPELFGAVIIQVPLLDMFRYPHLLAGASWMAEYGDPDDPAQWDFIKTFSPYHLVEPERTYPPVLLTTSTRDDRVHPGHARKMAALLEQLGKDVTYFENIEGGHGGAADNAQAAHVAALVHEFCWQRLSR